MGKRKINIEWIENYGARAVTFTKRRQGLFKKVSEFSRDFDVDLSLVVFSKAGHAFECGNSVNLMRGFLGAAAADHRVDHRSVQSSRPLFDDCGKTTNISFSADRQQQLLNVDVGKLSSSELDNYAQNLFALKSRLLNRSNAFYGSSYSGSMVSTTTLDSGGSSSFTDMPMLQAKLSSCDPSAIRSYSENASNLPPMDTGVSYSQSFNVDTEVTYSQPKTVDTEISYLQSFIVDTEDSYLQPRTVDTEVSYSQQHLIVDDTEDSYLPMLTDFEDLPLLDETLLTSTDTDDEVSHFPMTTFDDTTDASYLPTTTDFEGPPLEEKLLHTFTAEPVVEMSKYDDYVHSLVFGESHFFRHMTDLAPC